MKLHIATITHVLFEGEATSVSLPTQNGELSILDNHTPITTILAKGTISLTTDNGQHNEHHIEGGFLEVRPNSEVIVLVTTK